MKKSIYTSGQEALQELLRVTRQKSGLTQRQMAKKLGTLQAIVSNYETGERRLDVLELRQVCQALDVHLPDFMNALEAVLAGAAVEDMVELHITRKSSQNATVRSAEISADPQSEDPYSEDPDSEDPQSQWNKFASVTGNADSPERRVVPESNFGGTRSQREPEQEPLVEERRFFAESLPGWRQEHEGEFALVQGRALLGFFRTFSEAVMEGARRFGTAGHLIREVGPRKRILLSAREVGVIGGDLTGPISGAARD